MYSKFKKMSNEIKINYEVSNVMINDVDILKTNEKCKAFKYNFLNSLDINCDKES